MNRIEKGLHEHHARAEEARNNPAISGPQALASSSGATTLEAPFAKVNGVVSGSPADSAGLKVGDSITRFGWVDWTNHNRLSRVAEAVSQNEGVSCPWMQEINRPRKIPADLKANHATAAHHGQSATSQRLRRSVESCADATYANAKLGRQGNAGLPFASAIEFAACLRDKKRPFAAWHAWNGAFGLGNWHDTSAFHLYHLEGKTLAKL
jgi:hypothetical protein